MLKTPGSSATAEGSTSLTVDAALIRERRLFPKEVGVSVSGLADHDHQPCAVDAPVNDRVLYDQEACDEGLGRTFLRDLEQREDVRLLAKLPG